MAGIIRKGPEIELGAWNCRGVPYLMIGGGFKGRVLSVLLPSCLGIEVGQRIWDGALRLLEGQRCIA